MQTSPYFAQQYWDPTTGKPAAAGQLAIYQAGSTTLANIYADRAGSIARANPMTLDGQGFAPQYYVQEYQALDYKAFGAMQPNGSRASIFTALDVVCADGSGSGSGSDHKVSVGIGDGAPDFLAGKMVSSESVEVSIVAPGGIQKLSMGVSPSWLIGWLGEQGFSTKDSFAAIATTGSASDLETGSVPLACLPSHASTHLAGGSDPIAGQSLSGLRTTDSPVFNAVQAGPAHIGEFAGASGLAWYGKQGYNSPAYLNGMAFDGVSAYLGVDSTGILGIQRGGTTVAKFGAVLNNGFVRGGADASLASSPLAVADLPASVQTAQAIPDGRVALGNGSSGLTSDSTVALLQPTSDPYTGFQLRVGSATMGTWGTDGSYAWFGVNGGNNRYDIQRGIVTNGEITIVGSYGHTKLVVNGRTAVDAWVRADDKATVSVYRLLASQYVGSLLRITTDVSGHMSAGSLATTIVLASSTGTILDPLPSASFGEESNIGVVVHLLNNTGHSVAYSTLFTIPTGASRTVVWNGSAWE